MSLREILRPAGRVWVRRVAYAVIAAAGFVYRQFLPVRQTSRAEPTDILLIRLDLLGDVLFSLAAAEALKQRYPRARITMLTLPYTAPLARMSRFVDTVVTVDTNLIRRPRGLVSPATWIMFARAIARLRRQRFDVAISLSGQMASLWACLSGATRSIGYAGEAYPYLLTDPFPGGRYDTAMHEVEYVLRLARAAGAEPGIWRPAIDLPTGAVIRARKLLERNGIDGHATVVAIHAGATNGSAKRWIPERWAALANGLLTNGNTRVVLVGAAGDKAIAEEVVSRAPGVTDLAGKTDVQTLCALLARADLIATGDSGPLHLAVALRRPLLCVYGPTNPAIHGPYHPTAPVELLRADLWCSPCYTMAAAADCPLGDAPPLCMHLVGVREMLAGARRLLHGDTEECAPRQAAPNTSFL